MRPGGVVAAAAISRFASLHDGLARGVLFDDDFSAVVARDLADGCHTNPDNRPGWFTTAYFHRPDELIAEVCDAELTLSTLVGIEGLAGWLANLDNRWDNPADRARIVESARAVEAEPSLLGLSPHLLALAHRPLQT